MAREKKKVRERTKAEKAALRAAFRESDGDLDGTARRLAKLAEAV